jgi:hypothetical protein
LRASIGSAQEPLPAAWLQLWDGNAKAEVILDFEWFGHESVACTAAKRFPRRAAKGFGALAGALIFRPLPKRLPFVTGRTPTWRKLR